MRRLSADEGKVAVVTPDGCGCLESAIVGCLFCCHRCSSERLGSAMAFFPPKPPSYFLVEDVTGKCHARYRDGGSQIAAGSRLAAYDAEYVDTKRGNKIVVLSMDAPSGCDPVTAITLIVSHGNALDCALFVPFGRRLRDSLGVNIMLYDYSGYGTSTGKATPKNVYADLTAVVAWAVRHKKRQPSRIVLYGQSIGSAPTVWYAAQAGVAWDGALQKDGAHLQKNTTNNANASRVKKNKVVAEETNEQSRERLTVGSPSSTEHLQTRANPKPQTRANPEYHQIGGVVLISPILSGLRVISGSNQVRGFPNRRVPPCAAVHSTFRLTLTDFIGSNQCCSPANVFGLCDVFPNHKAVAKIRCPTLVMHGKRDVQVPFSHGETLWKGLVGAKSLDLLLDDSEKINHPSESNPGGSTSKALSDVHEITHPSPYWVVDAGHDDVYERNQLEFVTRMKCFCESVVRTADRQELSRLREEGVFNGIRNDAERVRSTFEFNATRDDAEFERDAERNAASADPSGSAQTSVNLTGNDSSNNTSAPGNSRFAKTARRDDGAPVKTQTMTR